MSQKINAKAINTMSIEMLSAYNVATLKVAAIRNKYKALIDAQETKLESIKANRKQAMEEGMDRDEAIVKFATDLVESEITRLETAMKEEIKPENENIKDVLKLVDELFYPAYALYTQNGNIKATGSITLTEGKKQVEYAIPTGKSFNDITADFLKSLGVKYTDDDKAMKKAMSSITVWTSGMMKDNKTGGLKLRTKSDLKNVLVRACIKYFVDNNVLTMSKSGKLSRVEKAEVSEGQDA